MLIEANFKDTCRGCGERIDIGDEIHWRLSEGPRCADCGPHTDEPRGASTGLEDAPGYVRVLEKRIEALEKNHAEDVMALAQRIDLLHGWAVDLSAELNIAPPRVTA